MELMLLLLLAVLIAGLLVLSASVGVATAIYFAMQES